MLNFPSKCLNGNISVLGIVMVDATIIIRNTLWSTQKCDLRVTFDLRGKLLASSFPAARSTRCLYLLRSSNAAKQHIRFFEKLSNFGCGRKFMSLFTKKRKPQTRLGELCEF